MKEKKTAVITFRTEEWVKEILEKAAKENKWSVAQTVNELCKKFVVNPQPETITIRVSDLIAAVEEIKAEGEDKAVKLMIWMETNEDETELIKTLNFDVLECGGHGCISGFDTIYELSHEELLDIP